MPIDRYQTPEMKELWSESNKLATWELVERAVVDGWAAEGLIPASDVLVIQSTHPNRARVLALESVTRHDVVAFVQAYEEACGSAGRWIHYGMTSSDLVDTALAYRMRKACKLIQGKLGQIQSYLHSLAQTHADVPRMGRTHGVHAEPSTFGRLFKVWESELTRCLVRLESSAYEMSHGKISGSLGDNRHIPGSVELRALAKLRMIPETNPTQVIGRDRLAMVISTLAVTASVVERIATDIRHLQRTEVAELRIEFSDGQIGSSSMPHKRNPIQAENICGLCRLVRSAVIPALEDVVLWHERDISHSSVERVICQDSTSYLFAAFCRLFDLLRNLRIDQDRAAEFVAQSADDSQTQALMLALIRDGHSRIEALKLARMRT